MDGKVALDNGYKIKVLFDQEILKEGCSFDEIEHVQRLAKLAVEEALETLEGSLQLVKFNPVVVVEKL